MNQWKMSFLTCLILYSTFLFSMEASLKQKYPYQCLTDDYGILNEADLSHYIRGIKPRKFSTHNAGLVYWQCFPSAAVSVYLRDFGYTAEEWGPDENVSDIEIIVKLKNGITHEYGMRRPHGINEFKRRVQQWNELKRGQQYVCLSGSFVNRVNKIIEGEEREINGWIFDRIKSKKGCSGFFETTC